MSAHEKKIYINAIMRLEPHRNREGLWLRSISDLGELWNKVSTRNRKAKAALEARKKIASGTYLKDRETQERLFRKTRQRVRKQISSLFDVAASSASRNDSGDS